MVRSEAATVGKSTEDAADAGSTRGRVEEATYMIREVFGEFYRLLFKTSSLAYVKSLVSVEQLD